MKRVTQCIVTFLCCLKKYRNLVEIYKHLSKQIVVYYLKNLSDKELDEFVCVNSDNARFDGFLPQRFLWILKDKIVDNNSLTFLPLAWASDSGHFEITKYLLNCGQIDPSHSHNAALLMAAKNKHIDVVQLLLSDKRVNPYGKDLPYTSINDNNHYQVLDFLANIKKENKKLKI